MIIYSDKNAFNDNNDGNMKTFGDNKVRTNKNDLRSLLKMVREG